MRTAILVQSVHHQNTARLAQAIAKVLQADLFDPQQASAEALAHYDLVGFGSGIYFGRFHSQLRNWVKELAPSPPTRPAFLFSTAGLPALWRLWHASFKRSLAEHGFQVLGEFSCPGHDTVGPLWLFGGLNRGRPNAIDLARAADFARSLLVQYPA